MNRIKVMIAVLCLVGGAVVVAPMVLSGQELEPDCIYSEYRAPDGSCFGATIRLCQGPANCPR